MSSVHYFSDGAHLFECDEPDTKHDGECHGSEQVTFE